MTYDQKLVHYGVKGMRWGRRKASSASNDGKNLRTRIKERDTQIKTARIHRNKAALDLAYASKSWNDAEAAGESQKKVKALQAVERSKAKKYALAEKKYGETASKKTAAEYAMISVGVYILAGSVASLAMPSPIKPVRR